MAKTKTQINPRERTLAPGERRFVAKPYANIGRKVTNWEVYDRQRASWPIVLPEPFGRISTRHKTEASAQAEADRLEALR